MPQVLNHSNHWCPLDLTPVLIIKLYQLKSNLLLQSGRRKLLDLWGRHLQDCKEFLSSFSQWRGWTSTGRAVSSWSAAVTADTSTCGTSTPPASFSLWRATEEEWWVREYMFDDRTNTHGVWVTSIHPMTESPIILLSWPHVISSAGELFGATSSSAGYGHQRAGPRHQTVGPHSWEPHRTEGSKRGILFCSILL